MRKEGLLQNFGQTLLHIMEMFSVSIHTATTPVLILYPLLETPLSQVLTVANSPCFAMHLGFSLVGNLAPLRLHQVTLLQATTVPGGSLHLPAYHFALKMQGLHSFPSPGPGPHFFIVLFPTSSYLPLSSKCTR